jgi:predicted outer membrane repeat protein
MKCTRPAAAVAAIVGIATIAVPAGLPGAMALAAGNRVIYLPCSVSALSNAISSAVNGEQIKLASGCRYVLRTALPDLAANMTIDGDDATIERSTAAGTPDFSDLTIDSPTSYAYVTINDLNIRNGDYQYGGGIDNYYGDLTVNGGDFSGNNSNLGGAIFNDAQLGNMANVLTVTSATFADNYASQGNGLAGGGGIMNYGTATITNCVFTRNGTAAIGGGFFNTTNATIAGSRFSDNQALAGAGLANSDEGNAVLDISGTAFIGNEASIAGGGIANTDILSVTTSQFSRNIAVSGGGLYSSESASVVDSALIGNVAAENGGGIANENDNGFGVSLTLTNTLLDGNTAGDDGGAIHSSAEGIPVPPSTVSVTGGRIEQNSALGAGGGIYNDDTVVTLSDAVVTTNSPENCVPLNTIAGCSN